MFKDSDMLKGLEDLHLARSSMEMEDAEVERVSLTKLRVFDVTKVEGR